MILAEGLAAESYLDTGNRAAFANGGAVAMAHPDFALKVWAAAACARLVTAGPVRDLVAARLLARAALLGHATTGMPRRSWCWAAMRCGRAAMAPGGAGSCRPGRRRAC